MPATDPTGTTAGPPDLAHAIQADAVYMVEQLQQQRNDWVTRANQYARERDDALEELQAARDRLAALESAIDWQTSCTTCAKVLDASTAYHERADRAERERANLQVQVAELHDLLQQVWELHGGPEPTALWVTQPFGQKVGAALQTDPPARGRAILEEVERLRKVIDATTWITTSTGDYCHICGGDRPVHVDGCALDLGAAQEEDGGG